MTGQLGLQGLTDPAVKEALDLCLECKACKSECPTNVDMARLKAEFLHQYYQKHGVPWRNWIFGNVATLSAWMPGWWVRGRIGRWFNETLFGIDSRRIAPRFARFHSNEFDDPGKVIEANKAGVPVLFFPDTFTEYFGLAPGTAVHRLLASLGCPVVVGTGCYIHFPLRHWPSGLRCCGRPLISNGLLDKAVSFARQNVERLHPWAVSGKPIIACEPSCILTIKDDYPALLRGEERRKAEVVAAACQTFEEFMESVLASGGRKPPEKQSATDTSLRGLTPPGRQIAFRPGPKKILVQPHCHQRALVGVAPLMNLLRRIPGAEVIDLDAGCCGMAGSFGYEKEHYEISRLVGEQRLFPAIRQTASDDVIVAPGFSCRLQIEHFTGRKAVHPAELLFSLLEKDRPEEAQRFRRA